MSPGEAVLVALAGLLAGGINAVVGSGTLVTFPVLLAVGLPPVGATVSNTLGLVPGNVASALGYRRELRGLGPLVRRLLPASVAGAVAGALLLLHLPAAAFAGVVPVLVALAVLLVATQPLLTRALARTRPTPGGTAGEAVRVGPLRTLGLVAAALGTGTYGGYFAASQGVLQIGLFGLILDLPLQRLNAVKNVLTSAVNGVAAVVYVATGADRVHWVAAGLVACGSLLGGTLGSRWGRRLPAPVLRGAVVVLGVTALVVLAR